MNLPKKTILQHAIEFDQIEFIRRVKETLENNEYALWVTLRIDYGDEEEIISRLIKICQNYADKSNLLMDYINGLSKKEEENYVKRYRN